jgi:hypothetical protein
LHEDFAASRAAGRSAAKEGAEAEYQMLMARLKKASG